MKSKDFRIFAGRPSLIGDIVTYLPFFTWLEKMFPNSYKIFCLSPQCYQMAHFLLNHPLIDKIHMTTFHDKMSVNEQMIANSCQEVFEPNPPVLDPYWYNKHNVIEQQFLMSYSHTHNGFVTKTDYDYLTPEEKQPKLYKWFQVIENTNVKSIGFWPFAGYNQNDETSKKRSLSPTKWLDVVLALRKNGFLVFQFGHPNSPLIPGAIDQRHLDFFTAIRSSLGCTVSLGTDSGSMHVLGAYGAKQVCLTTNWRENHVQNLQALVPVNNQNNLINIFSPSIIDNITVEQVVEAVKK